MVLDDIEILKHKLSTDESFLHEDKLKKYLKKIVKKTQTRTCQIGNRAYR